MCGSCDVLPKTRGICFFWTDWRSKTVRNFYENLTACRIVPVFLSEIAKRRKSSFFLFYRQSLVFLVLVTQHKVLTNLLFEPPLKGDVIAFGMYKEVGPKYCG